MTLKRICEKHNKPIIKNCSWCGKPMCNDCIKESGSNKYCSECIKKYGFKKDNKKEKRIIRNVDETLTEEQIKEAKERLIKEEKKPRIRNIPDNYYK